MDKNKLLKISVIATDIFFVILIVIAFLLPMLVTWYVEIRGREASLPTTILVTCYPCAPFTGAALLYLRKVVKNTQKGEIFTDGNIKILRNISICCCVISLITLFAGRYYLPFYIVGATFAFLSLLVFVFRSIFIAAKQD